MPLIRTSLADKIGKVLGRLPSVTQTIVIDYTGGATTMAATLPQAQSLDAFRSCESALPITFAQLPFDHPLYIMFSSGTTGAPKCIVHGAGGTLLQHLKEHQLQCDVRPGDRVIVEMSPYDLQRGRISFRHKGDAPSPSPQQRRPNFRRR